MNTHQDEHVHTQAIKPGISRVQELADLLDVSRTTINRYIEKFSLQLEDLVHQNKPVKGIVLDDDSIEKITILLNQGSTDQDDRCPSMINHQDTQVQPMFERMVELEKGRATLETEVRLLKELLTSKDSEISTLKSALLIAERYSQQKPIIELEAKPLGLIGKLKALLKN
jgi:predicted RNase H-like nuclease (RuvC/YqgF family)